MHTFGPPPLIILLLWYHPAMAPRIAIAFLVLTFLSCSATYAQQDYLFLHLRWPGGVCPNVGDCCFPNTYPKQNDFTVQYMARSLTGSVCPGNRFYANALQPLMSELNKYWPSFDCIDGPNFQEWEQTWYDNGDCTGLQVRDYFSRALTLRNKANLLDVLSRNGIRPSHYNTYRTTDVVNAINQGLGVVNATVLHCGSTKLERIMNVRLCVDITATNFIACPRQQTSVCPDRVKLEVLPSDSALLKNPIEMVVAQ